MRVLIAPDKFKGTLTAPQAAAALAAGWRRVRPDDVLAEVPMADGGDGTLETLLAALGGRAVPVRVSGPLGDPVDAAIGLVETADGRTAVIELARCSGLAVIHERRREAMRASSRGTGEAIVAALGLEPSRVLVCVGGSASTDGGAGIASALGARLLDAGGRDVRDGGAGLLDLARIDSSALDRRVRSVRVTVAVDVEHRLCGPWGAAQVFGPQKGASRAQVLELDRALTRYAAVLERDLGVDVRAIRGGGAAGGAAAGLFAFAGARIRRGVDVVAEAVGLPEAVESAEVVVTGEGAFDGSSLSGKVVSGVLELAARHGARVALACGRIASAPEGVRALSLVDLVGEVDAVRDARRALEAAGEVIAAEAGSVSSAP